MSPPDRFQDYLDAGLGKEPDRTVADRLHVSRQALHLMRKRHPEVPRVAWYKPRRDRLAREIQQLISSGNGKTAAGIARRTGVAPVTVRAAAVEHGIELPRQVGLEITAADVLKAVQDTDRLTQAALSLGLSHAPYLWPLIDKLGIRKQVDTILETRGYTRKSDGKLTPGRLLTQTEILREARQARSIPEIARLLGTSSTALRYWLDHHPGTLKQVRKILLSRT